MEDSSKTFVVTDIDSNHNIQNYSFSNSENIGNNSLDPINNLCLIHCGNNDGFVSHASVMNNFPTDDNKIIPIFIGSSSSIAPYYNIVINNYSYDVINNNGDKSNIINIPNLILINLDQSNSYLIQSVICNNPSGNNNSNADDLNTNNDDNSSNNSNLVIPMLVADDKNETYLQPICSFPLAATYIIQQQLPLLMNDPIITDCDDNKNLSVENDNYVSAINDVANISGFKTEKKNVSDDCDNYQNLSIDIHKKISEINNNGYVDVEPNAKHHNEKKFCINERHNDDNASYKCGECGIPFKQLSSLKRHCRIHRNEKPYSCDQCEKRFTQSCTLQAHKRVHTGEKPFTCKFCLKSFRQSTNLRTHMKRLHPSQFQMLLNLNLISQDKKKKKQ